MPCDGISTITARVTLDVTAIITNQQLALTAANGIAALLGLPPATTVKTERQGRAALLLYVGPYLTVRIDRDGTLTCSTLWSGQSYGTPISEAQLSAAAEQVVAALAGLATQARLLEQIGRLCPIEQTRRAANGALVLTVNL